MLTRCLSCLKSQPFNIQPFCYKYCTNRRQIKQFHTYKIMGFFFLKKRGGWKKSSCPTFLRSPNMWPSECQVSFYQQLTHGLTETKVDLGALKGGITIAYASRLMANHIYDYICHMCKLIPRTPRLSWPLTSSLEETFGFSELWG